MLKGRGRDPRSVTSPPPAPAHLASLLRPPTLAHAAMRPATPTMHRTPLNRPEPDYEVVEFPSEQYVNAKIQPPPPPPPRPPTGHPVDAGASCGLCGGGGARVRCTECGRRALCASCDDMYHRHPKRRHHQRQALSQSQLRDERPPLPPKTAPPVPPPRKHKISGDRLSASPKPPVMDQRRATLSSPHHISMIMGAHGQAPSMLPSNHIQPQHVHQQMPLHLQTKLTTTPSPSHIGSMPFLPTNMHHTAPPQAQSQGQSNTLTHMNTAWNRHRGSLQGFGLHPNMAIPPEPWGNADNMAPAVQNWGRPLRRGASVLELSGGAAPACAGCAHCAPMPWRYGSCASLDHPWANSSSGWAPQGSPTCCAPGHPTHNPHNMHPHPHIHHQPQTPQPYRRAESRAVSRAASRAGSRAASPAMSSRSRTSRRPKHRTPSPPLPSSDADSESESESDNGLPIKPQEKEDDSLGPAPPPPNTTWQCEHCTYVNEPGVRVCAICCRTPVTVPQTITKELSEKVERLKVSHKEYPSPARVMEEFRIEREVEKSKIKSKKERTSTGCGPSPPRDGSTHKKPINRLVTPTRESNNNHSENMQRKHDMAVGPSPPREVPNGKHTRTDMGTEISPSRDTNKTMRVSPFQNNKESPRSEVPKQHSISVGPSPPRDNTNTNPPNNSSTNVQKKSTGTSPPRDGVDERRSSALTTNRTNVSNTGTSPPPQSISTQTYEVPNSITLERAPSASRSRPRRRFRDDSRRERSQSRHSMSSDTRESDRSIRTAGPGNRWEWRERDSSPGGEWGDSYSRLSRRASHLDLRRTRPNRRSTYYGSEAASPERQSTTRAISLEALAGAGAKREAERGLELAQLMGEAERLGFSAAEVQAALTQSPASPLAWLRERWPSLCAGVRAAAARLAPNATITELEARASLARHRGAMWPAVTECVERHRRQTDIMGVGEEGRLRGHVWGSPMGADDEAAPPRSSSRHSHRMREDSSDEYEAPTPPKFEDDDWMYLPLNVNINDYEREAINIENKFTYRNTTEKEDVVKKIKMLLQEAGVPSIDENLLLQGLLSGNASLKPENNLNIRTKTQPIDLIESENDFIDAYNALTRSSPLPNINKPANNAEIIYENKLILNSQDFKKKKTLNAGEVNDSNPEPENQNEFKQSQNIDSSKTSGIKQNNNNRPIKNEQVNPNLVDKSNGIIQPATLQSSNSVSNSENLNKTEENVIHRDNHRQIDEKSNNLTDIVDNTQRLIQQMKEEINSDINSIDGRTVSQSEAESSSDGSNDEQESSYSESEERTDNLTSDEKEVTSSEESEDDDEVPPDTQQVSEYRTSSEENENFEEALDHVENQLEDFKHTNIEMLDSIARTLQEEHTFAVEINESKPVEPDILSPTRKQDLNNNLFSTVNSFEEIYEEINTENNVNKGVRNEQVINKNANENLEQNIQVFAREAVILSVIKAVAPTKLVISENKLPVFNAILENIEQKPNDNTNTTEQKFDIESVSEELNTQPALDQVAFKNESSHVNNLDDIVHTFLEENDEDIGKFTLKLPENFNSNETSLEDIPTHSSNTSLSGEHVETLNNQQIKLPEPFPVDTQNESSTNKNSPTNKSNIPKLIRIMPSNSSKSKTDKSSPKLIVSKVPIRRTSMKQYPAPNPPKSHFGNIQSGHVKQLQTRLFNNKVIPSKPVPTSSEIPEVKATTSTLNKKKQAPAPPLKQKEDIQVSPPKSTTPPKVKKQYFRETCRTEDEWTDSDSEDSQKQQIIKPTEESKHSPPSPPPPITLRRVSGQIIDLAKVRLPDGSPERQARMLLAEGATETWEQAQLAVELISQGADPPVALLAALECVDLTSALAYLYQDCELCASRLPEHEMVSMLRCTHRCCRECAHHYFTVQITERSIADCVCPYCKLPELESLPEDAWLEYFAHLDILLKTLVEIDVHELFQRKLRDRTLARDPNFRWCMECSSGFFVHPKQKKVRCPECRSISCASCRKPWSANHEGLSCEQYTAWLEDNDPERSVTAIQQHLRDNGLECPRCHFKYSLSRGGCMHFTCTQCKYEFCYGCGKPFTMGARCGLSEYCAKLGLHAHHPRNCLFYLRDKEPHDLQTLLQMNNVTYESQTAEGSTGRCPVQLQRETPTGLVDGTCGNEAPANYAGLCKGHYVEYLAGLARGLDPIPIMDVTDLVAELRRRALPLPERGPWDTDPIYAGMCAEIVKEKIPLD